MPKLFDITVPVFQRALSNLSKHLDKARNYADDAGIAHDELLSARLYPDMLPLTGQVQRMSDTAKFVPARVGGLTAPSMPDTEASLDDLQARIAATIDYLNSVPSTAFDGRESNEVVLKFGPRSITFPTATDYALVFALPNFYFHATTAYGILRHKGVPLGKLDFIGAA